VQTDTYPALQIKDSRCSNTFKPADCLLTEVPKVLGLPGELMHPPDPVAWALDMFAASLPEADMQSRDPANGEQPAKLTYFDQHDPASFEHFRHRIQNALPVHGSQVLFIPSGAMREVVAHGEQPAVSVSFHMGSPFPLLTLCAQLNMMVRGGEVTVPPYMKKLDKFNMYFFEPSRFAGQPGDAGDGMPAELLTQLADVLQSKQVDPATTRRLLSNWWRLANSRPMYQGPYPERQYRRPI